MINKLIINQVEILKFVPTFIAVAQSRNFIEAASKMGLSQPGITIQMRRLEELLPSPLFKLQGKRKVLTHYGQELYQLLSTHLDQLNTAFMDLNSKFQDDQSLSLRIAGRAEVLEMIVPKLQFKGKILMQNLSSQKANEALLDHKIDMAITYIKPSSFDIFSRELFKSRLYVIWHKKWKDFSQAPFIQYHSDQQNFPWNEILSVSSLDTRWVVTEWSSVKSLVESGLGFSVVPEYVKDLCSKDIYFEEIKNRKSVTLTFYALYRKELKQISGFKELLSFKNF
jgi:DNA-binding transcriptional LysR family regulator